MISVIDYGVGNIFSLISSLRYVGADCKVTSDEKEIRNSDKIILPGVGAFGDAMAKLKSTGLDRAVIEEANKGKAVMGICLGMQLLFDKSYEFGEHTGLGLINGEVVSMKGRISSDLQIPQIGWNSLIIKKQSPLLKYISDGDFVYYVHSYFVDGSNEYTVAGSEYGAFVTGIAQKNNVFGCQFHPEKSGEKGLLILKAFDELKT